MLFFNEGPTFNPRFSASSSVLPNRRNGAIHAGSFFICGE